MIAGSENDQARGKNSASADSHQLADDAVAIGFQQESGAMGLPHSENNE